MKGVVAMSAFVELTASDGFTLSAWRADPEGKPRAAIVVIQEIFGVNHHIRGVADFFASQGYLAIAPALFDRVQKGVDLGYGGSDRQTAMALMGKLDNQSTALDVAAAIQAAKQGGKVAVVGYCLGGSIAYVAASRLPDVSAAVCYYGGRILDAKDDYPKVPTILHFGEKDAHIPIARVKDFAAAHPELPVYTYPADHGFNCDERASYDAPAATLARTRTLEFLAKTIG
jgi:carboxymethylenebutenolidase